MTRSDYETLAELCKESQCLFTSEKRFGQFVVMTADRLEADNRQFNRYSFFKAIGIV